MNKIDRYICNIFFTGRSKKFCKSKFIKLNNGDYKNIKNYLLTRFSDSDDIKESIYRIYYKIDIAPKCKSCGNKLLITYKPKQLYRDFCSYNCSNSDSIKKEKYKNTCLEKYGVPTTYLSNTKKCTMLSKYGTIYPLQNTKIKEKRNITLKNNSSYNISKPEEEYYIFLKEKYPDIIRQYSSDVYPFNCDFYIPSIDTYIEYQGSWTHGEHPFDPTNKDDIDKVNLWKSKNTKYYDNAIKTWTIRDVNKRNIAKENNLKFIEVWN